MQIPKKKKGIIMSEKITVKLERVSVDLSLYELFQRDLLKDSEKLEIGKLRKLERILLIQDQKEIQVLYNEFKIRSYYYE